MQLKIMSAKWQPDLSTMQQFRVGLSGCLTHTYLGAILQYLQRVSPWDTLSCTKPSQYTDISQSADLSPMSQECILPSVAKAVKPCSLCVLPYLLVQLGGCGGTVLHVPSTSRTLGSLYGLWCGEIKTNWNTQLCFYWKYYYSHTLT